MTDNINYKDARCIKFEKKFDKDVLENYPFELLENRELLEMSYVFCMWKNPEFFNEYADINPSKDLITNDGRFFYDLGKSICGIGVKSIDDASIHAFLKEDKELLEQFNKKGGYKVFQTLRKVLSVDNMESYYENLIRHNMLMGLYKKGFAVIDNLSMLTKMTTSQIYDYFEYQLDNTFLNRGAGVKIEDLVIDDEFVDECDQGLEKGLSYASTAPLLNYHTLGVHRSNVMIFAGYSGTGKTSFVMNTYVMPILDAGEGITIVANEMNIKAWKHILLATVLSQKLKYFGLPRKKQKTGGFNAEQKAKIKEAQEYINKHYKGRIKFAKIYDYSIEDVKRVFKKMSKLGLKYGLFDTFKAEDSSAVNMTGELIEASKQLLQVAEKEDMGIIVTMQLAIHTENQRYLTAGTLSGAKGVKEVVSELVLMRKLWDDEFNKKSYDVKPWKNRRDPLTGKITDDKIYFELDESKRYRIMFLDKTRNDEEDICLLYQFDGAWNKWTEIGYCTVSHKNRTA